LGPVYETPSKRPYGAPLGIDTFRKAKRSVTIPLFAIGGINRARLKEVFDAGADGVAVISAITAAEDIQKAAQELLDDIKRLRAT
ncbi:MAG TPA: thiamine phosphate synthase, partial [Candidatus Manganitrophaceae bacterium]